MFAGDLANITCMSFVRDKCEMLLASVDSQGCPSLEHARKAGGACLARKCS